MNFLTALKKRRDAGPFPVIPDIKSFSPKEGDLLRGRAPVSLALQLFNDPSSGSDIGSTLAMSTLSIIPATVLFLIFQKSLVEGIASTGIKG